MNRLKAIWHLLRHWRRGWLIITIDKDQTYGLADMTPGELVDAAQHATSMAGNTVEQESAVATTKKILSGGA